EEVGVRGAATSAFGIDPDLGLAVDVTSSGDTPDSPTKNADLGKGPVIKIRDPGMVSDPRVVDWITRTAEKARIPHQHEVDVIGSTDARAIQISRAGVPVGAISIPCRYVHSPSEMVDYNDVQNTVKLLVALLSKEIKL
ncbi:MAG: M20/M25/M40 family metallo-hydrolase, partial [Anaerolineae bacterium]|nr:M20/M25/M40 family metallo-hydrolase [Anaerolineae bacterium]